jgi:hypothetical protein
MAMMAIVLLGHAGVMTVTAHLVTIADQLAVITARFCHISGAVVPTNLRAVMTHFGTITADFSLCMAYIGAVMRQSRLRAGYARCERGRHRCESANGCKLELVHARSPSSGANGSCHLPAC